MQSAHVTVYTCKQPEEKAGIYLSLGLQNLLIVEKNLKEKDEGATFSFQQMKLERISADQYESMLKEEKARVAKKTQEKGAQPEEKQQPVQEKPSSVTVEEKQSAEETLLQACLVELEEKQPQSMSTEETKPSETPTIEVKAFLLTAEDQKETIEKGALLSASDQERADAEKKLEFEEESQSKYFESKKNSFQTSTAEDKEIFVQMKEMIQKKEDSSEGRVETKIEQDQAHANEYQLYLKLKREREEEKRRAEEKRREEDMRLIQENPKIVHLNEDKKMIPEKKVKQTHDSINKNVSKLNKKNRVKRELEKKEEHREEHMKRLQEEEAAKQERLTELRQQEQKEKAEARAELERREAQRVANLTPEQREQERLRKEREDKLLRAFAQGKKKEPLRQQKPKESVIIPPKPTPVITSPRAEEANAISSVGVSVKQASAPILPPQSAPTTSAIKPTITSSSTNAQNIWREFSSSISSSPQSTVTTNSKSPAALPTSLPVPMVVPSARASEPVVTQTITSPPVTTASSSLSISAPLPKTSATNVANNLPVAQVNANKPNEKAAVPVVANLSISSNEKAAVPVAVNLSIPSNEKATVPVDVANLSISPRSLIVSIPPGLSVQTDSDSLNSEESSQPSFLGVPLISPSMPSAAVNTNVTNNLVNVPKPLEPMPSVYPSADPNSMSWFSPLVSSPSNNAQSFGNPPISNAMKPLSLPLSNAPMVSPSVGVKPLSYSALVSSTSKVVSVSNASPQKVNQQPKIPTAPQSNSPPRAPVNSYSSQASKNLSKANQQQQQTTKTTNAISRPKTTRNVLPPSLVPVEYCKCPPNTNVRMIVFPESFYCPISGDMMVDPVIDLDGITYERLSITTWLKKSYTSPLTRKPLYETDLRPNRALKECIDQFRGQTISKTVPQFCCDCGLTLPGL